MPTYDYRCRACGHTLEKFHSPEEKVSRTCPRCRRRQLERQIGTGGGIIFRGSGFYETDYRSSTYQSEAKQDSGTKDGSKKNDSKPGASASSKKGAESKGSGAKDTA